MIIVISTIVALAVSACIVAFYAIVQSLQKQINALTKRCNDSDLKVLQAEIETKESVKALVADFGKLAISMLRQAHAITSQNQSILNLKLSIEELSLNSKQAYEQHDVVLCDLIEKVFALLRANPLVNVNSKSTNDDYGDVIVIKPENSSKKKDNKNDLN